MRTAVLHTVWVPADDESKDSMYPAGSNCAVADHPMTVAELAPTTDRAERSTASATRNF